jgi:Ni/Fe-hydrogenase 1 B-type cytochrome subunit
MTSVRVWDLVVRTTHWAIACSLLLLTVTGLAIGRPFLSSGPFVIGWMKILHFYAAILFSLAVFARIVWMFTGGRYASWRYLIPVTRERWRGVLDTLRFYLFLRSKPAASVGHNPLAGLAYAGIFGLYLVMIATGLGLYAGSAHVESPFRLFGFLLGPFGGAQTARWIHHLVTWVFVLFALQHVYSSWLTSVVEKNGTIDSIFSGNKWLRPGEADEERV